MKVDPMSIVRRLRNLQQRMLSMGSQVVLAYAPNCSLVGEGNEMTRSVVGCLEQFLDGEGYVAPGVLWKDDQRTVDLAKLLLEAQVALPAISLTAARERNLDLTLVDRIEAALKPWELGGEENET